MLIIMMMLMILRTWKTWWRRVVYLLQSSLRCTLHPHSPSSPGVDHYDTDDDDDDDHNDKGDGDDDTVGHTHASLPHLFIIIEVMIVGGGNDRGYCGCR